MDWLDRFITYTLGTQVGQWDVAGREIANLMIAGHAALVALISGIACLIIKRRRQPFYWLAGIVALEAGVAAITNLLIGMGWATRHLGARVYMLLQLANALLLVIGISLVIRWLLFPRRRKARSAAD